MHVGHTVRQNSDAMFLFVMMLGGGAAGLVIAFAGEIRRLFRRKPALPAGDE